jgi:hypothetical protein
MELLDRLALTGRRYERVHVPGSGSTRFSMGDLFLMFGRSAILQLTHSAPGRAAATVKPDSVRKIKVSLLDDGLSAIHSTDSDYYEVYRTAPSGDLSKVRIVAYSRDGSQVGDLRMTLGRRSFEHYFKDDPILDAINDQGG